MSLRDSGRASRRKPDVLVRCTSCLRFDARLTLKGLLAVAVAVGSLVFQAPFLYAIRDPLPETTRAGELLLILERIDLDGLRTLLQLLILLLAVLLDDDAF